ncbi:hypothetical protein BJY52DRAFT_1315008 [Lactarius psammicola]|nr:hypothetical protein BJY52DRAFT_1315008 [Lactarius psammicola]
MVTLYVMAISCSPRVRATRTTPSMRYFPHTISNGRRYKLPQAHCKLIHFHNLANLGPPKPPTFEFKLTTSTAGWDRPSSSSFATTTMSSFLPSRAR